MTICTKCGFTFDYPGLQLSGKNNILSNVITDCPKCGAEARVPDGKYDFEKELSIFKGNFWDSTSKIKIINDLLHLKSYNSKDEFLNEISGISQSAGKYARGLFDRQEQSLGREVNVKEIISLLLIIFSAFLSSCRPADAKTTLEKKSNKIEVKNLRQPSKNAPCPCNSGKQFKRCHGLNDADDNKREFELNEMSNKIAEIKNRNR